jgi:hypothetical protein
MAEVMSRMSAELSTSEPTSLGVSLAGGSYCAAMGRKRGPRPLFHHSQNIMAATIAGKPSGQLLCRKSPTLSAAVGGWTAPLSKAMATVDVNVLYHSPSGLTSPLI